MLFLSPGCELLLLLLLVGFESGPTPTRPERDEALPHPGVCVCVCVCGKRKLPRSTWGKRN